jgi:hypothetical protein
MQMGFILDGPARMASHAALRATSAFEALPAQGLERSLAILRAEAFFDDPELTEAAEQAEAAYLRFVAALRSRANARS